MVTRSLPEEEINNLSISDQEQDDVALLQGLVSIESLSNREENAVDYLRMMMVQRGFTVLDSPVGSAVGTIGEGDRRIVLLGHIDTVPGRIPVRIEDGVLWGRGAVDAKGPLATFVAAASAAAGGLKANVTVVGAVGEEVIGSPGATNVATWPGPDLCIIGEPSGWDALCLGYRGSLSLVYTLVRSSRHTAGPGMSVGQEAVDFWNTLNNAVDARNRDAKGNFGRIAASLRAFNTTGNGLEDTARLSIGLRLPPGLDIDALVAQIRKIGGEATIAIDGVQAGYRTDKRSSLVPPFLRAIRNEGGTPRFSVKLGTSDMNVVGPVWNCPIAAYGPGDSSLDHTPDERIEIAEYLRSIRILRDVLLAL